MVSILHPLASLFSAKSKHPSIEEDRKLSFRFLVEDTNNMLVSGTINAIISINYIIVSGTSDELIDRSNLFQKNIIRIQDKFHGIIFDRVINCSEGYTQYLLNTKNVNSIRCFKNTENSDNKDKQVSSSEYTDYTLIRNIEKKFSYLNQESTDRLSAMLSCADLDYCQNFSRICNNHYLIC